MLCTHSVDLILLKTDKNINHYVRRNKTQGNVRMKSRLPVQNNQITLAVWINNQGPWLHVHITSLVILTSTFWSNITSFLVALQMHIPDYWLH